MPSSKGEPDKPELREKIKEEVKQMEKGEFVAIMLARWRIGRVESRSLGWSLTW